LWQNGDSKRWASLELDGKPLFKDAFYKIQLGYFFFVWNFNKSLIQSLYIGFTYPALSISCYLRFS
jgi:hypothetical protein